MAQKSQDDQLLLYRGSPDRRVATFSEPPFMTEEGMVLVDRRDRVDRRGWGELDAARTDWFDAAGSQKTP